MNWVTKKSILLISFAFSTFAIASGYISSSGQCFIGYKQCESIAYSFFIFVPIFIISLMSINSNQYFLGIWKKFVIWFTPISVILITISDRNPGDLFPIYKKTVLIISFVIFVFVSIFIHFRSKSREF